MYDHFRKERVINDEKARLSFIEDFLDNCVKPLVLSPGIYASLIGAGVVGGAENIAISNLTKILYSESSSKIFKLFLFFATENILSKSYRETFNTFRIWTESRNLHAQAIEDMNLTIEEDDELQIKRIGINKEGKKDLFYSNAYYTHKLLFNEKYRSRYFEKVLKIALTWDELNFLFWRTIRHDILTSDFILSTSALWSAGLIQGTLRSLLKFTGKYKQGALGFFICILALGGYEFFVPDGFKFDYSYEIKKIREEINISTYNMQANYIESINKKTAMLIDSSERIFEKSFLNLRKSREDLVNLYLENYYLAEQYKNIFEFELEYLKVEKTKPYNLHRSMAKYIRDKELDETIDDYENRLITLEELRKDSLNNIQKIYEDALYYYKKYLKQFDVSDIENPFIDFMVNVAGEKFYYVPNLTPELTKFMLEDNNLIQTIKQKLTIDVFPNLDRDIIIPPEYQQVLDEYENITEKEKNIIEDIKDEYFRLPQELSAVPEYMYGNPTEYIEKIVVDAILEQNKDLQKQYNMLTYCTKKLLIEVICEQIYEENDQDSIIYVHHWLSAQYLNGWNELALAENVEEKD